MTTIEDRAAGALVGVHVGDALGASVEFADATTIARRFPHGVREIVGGGPFGWEPGQPTDDTDLTWAITQGYLDDPEDVVRAAAARMVAWYRTRPRDIGGTTRAALGAIDHGADPSSAGRSDDHSQANGSLMRTMPVAVARLRDPVRRRAEAEALSAITHAHPVCLAACAAYCDLAALLITGDAPASAVAVVIDAEIDPMVRAALTDGLSADDPGALSGARGGYVLWALRLGVWALCHAPDVETGLVAVIAMGDDTDTNGAIAGGLLGAAHGLAAIPQRWRDVIHLGPQLEAFARSMVGEGSAHRVE